MHSQEVIRSVIPSLGSFFSRCLFLRNGLRDLAFWSLSKHEGSTDLVDRSFLISAWYQFVGHDQKMGLEALSLIGVNVEQSKLYSKHSTALKEKVLFLILFFYTLENGYRSHDSNNSRVGKSMFIRNEQSYVY
jgi:hypothetical protein